MKRIVLPFVLVVAAIGAGGLLAAGCVVHSGTAWVSGWNASEKATRTESGLVPVGAGGTLEIELSSGDVDVQAGGGGTSGYEALITTYGKTVEDAQGRLADTKLVVEELANGVRIRVVVDESDAKRWDGKARVVPRADLRLRVPAGVKLAFTLGSGDIRTSGPIAASRLKSGYGDVRVDEAEGDLVLESSSGKIELGRLTGARTLDARSSYGDVSARSVEADSIRLHSSSGDVVLEDAQAKSVEADSGYGDVKMTRVGGELDVRTSSGDVRAEELRGSRAKLASGYGTVVLAGMRGELTAATSSGNIRVSELEGECFAESGYGDVRVEGKLARFEGTSNSGSVAVRALAGSSFDVEWKLTSGYGDVSLVVPKEAGFEIDASTGYGSLDIEVPMTIAAGGLKEKHSVRGQVGQGGRRVVLKTSSGDVRVEPTTRAADSNR
jgi:DUF4097 and DUF4098 domain-containing protein YvlB